jgi:hypothetical protein
MTPAEVGLLVRRVLFDEWRQLVVSGYLTEDGLLAVRTRLDETPHEFVEGPDKELLRLLVDEAVARSRGIDLADMPGRWPTPDSPEGLTD